MVDSRVIQSILDAWRTIHRFSIHLTRYTTFSRYPRFCDFQISIYISVLRQNSSLLATHKRFHAVVRSLRRDARHNYWHKVENACICFTEIVSLPTTGRQRTMLDRCRVRRLPRIKADTQPEFCAWAITLPILKIFILNLQHCYVRKSFRFCSGHNAQLIGVLLKLVDCNSRPVEISFDLCHITLPRTPHMHPVSITSVFSIDDWSR